MSVLFFIFLLRSIKVFSTWWETSGATIGTRRWFCSISKRVCMQMDCWRTNLQTLVRLRITPSYHIISYFITWVFRGASERHLTQVYRKSLLSVYGARILFTRVGESFCKRIKSNKLTNCNLSLSQKNKCTTWWKSFHIIFISTDWHFIISHKKAYHILYSKFIKYTLF